jgi:hypothetical protein
MKTSLRSIALCAALCACWIGHASAEEPEGDGLKDWKVQPLASDYVELCRSPDPQTIACYTPGLAVCPNGRLVATMEFGGEGVKNLPAPAVGKGRGVLHTSDDKGKTWVYRTNFPIGMARPFVAGKFLYVLGKDKDLVIMRSEDWGETWSKPEFLTEGQTWHQSACNVLYAKDKVYLVMERRTRNVAQAWGVSELAPVLMRASVQDNLLKKKNWTFASELTFCDAVCDRDLDGLGVPFYPAYYPKTCLTALFRNCAPIGWLETNVVQFTDPNHVWYDEKGRTFHLWMRAHTGGTHLAAIAKVVENEDGSMTTQLEAAPSGERMVFVPCPGGQMRFHILYDDVTQLYWLLSSQSTDSMCRPDKLPPDRYSLPNNERHRLQLHFSRNCMDWCFAGLVAAGATPKQSRHYASMVIDGEDIHVLSRSGDAEALNAHDVNMITFHSIKDFRRLVY